MRIVGLALLLIGALGCGEENGVGAPPRPANEIVRERISAFGRPANFGHRGAGLNQSGNAYPEDSVSAFLHGLAIGADAAELDVNMTADGKLIVIHDDTLDRTTDCSGCVSAMTLAQVRQCHLKNGNGETTAEHPPTLDEVYAALPRETLVSVELKLYDPPCQTDTTNAAAVAAAGVAEIRRLGVADRTILCSFGADAIGAVKASAPDLYSALLVTGLKQRFIDQAVSLGLDALEPGGVFPFVQLPSNLLEAALAAGLQVHVWTVDDVPSMNAMIDAGVSSIITNFPDVLADELTAR